MVAELLWSGGEAPVVLVGRSGHRWGSVGGVLVPGRTTPRGELSEDHRLRRAPLPSVGAGRGTKMKLGIFKVVVFVLLDY
jgi:hypothetical protein